MSATDHRLHVPTVTPVQVVDMDLAEPGRFSPPGSRERIRPQGRVLALVRLRGHPLGMVGATGTDPARLWQSLADTARRELEVPAADSARKPSPPGKGAVGTPGISVVVATHNRCELLRRGLESLLHLDYPKERYEIVVVDNAPADDATERLIREEYRTRVRYVREPVAGLARARNRGLAAARNGIVAFTDDDTLVDPGWLSALAESFTANQAVSCVTGLIAPAELQTEAQAVLERHNGFGKGYDTRTWSLHDPPEDPLFPFTTGQFGGGANMAFRTEVLRALGGFDTATSAGTPAYGGEDLLVFFQVLVNGGTLAYQPDAIIWHSQRRSLEALSTQIFSYGAGFTAYLTAALVHEPRMLPVLLRKLPGGLRYMAARADRLTNDDGAGWSRRLTLLEVQGMLYGPLGYLRSRLSDRHHERDGHPRDTRRVAAAQRL
ncbi:MULTISPECIES: glycosyltransferase family 2 protein [unclassified Streptomyces]|uniref:glycosyltransferase n=1 Tax=unclassified Streptomyces TaxID=2593676 RepID=UPI0007F3AEE4|nr:MULTISPECIES: glycosyltransferase [unclassified Streptomyces]MCM1975019.1 glycosyltransferase [Streptomyces sp. G1]SBT88085.1 Glycosyl transferase family 2 [Streptomyces sp. DI166]